MTGTLALIRLILRRDRVLLPLWTVLIAVVPASYVGTIDGLYPTAADRAAFAETSRHSAAFVTLYGRLSGSSLGELVTWRAGFIPVVVAIICVLTVIRHTRTDEEAGRRDLLGATVLGRHAPLAAAVITTILASAFLGVLSALVLMSQKLGAAGSFGYGAQLFATGLAFAAVGALAAQLTSGAGAARGIAISAIGAAYVLRVVGDLSAQAGSGAGWISWVSPLGWEQELRPFNNERWWVLLPAAGFAAVVTAVAVALSAHRDVGSGILADRLGPAQAAPSLRSPLALAWRLHRGLLVAWVAGFAALGLVFGSVANSVGDLFNDNPQLADIFTRIGGRAGLIDSYLSAIMGILAIIAAAYAIQAALKLRTEETGGRAEMLLATRVGRVRWGGSHLAFVLAGPALAMLVGGFTTGLLYGISSHDMGQLPRMLGAALVQVPAVWILGALALALVGLAPRAVAVSWGALGACLFLTLVGAALQLNQRIMDVSPFTHVPKAPAAHVTATPLILLALVAAGLTALALTGLRRRDIPVP